MLERLGHVLGWAGNLLAVLALIGTAVFFFSLRNNESSEAHLTQPDPFLVRESAAPSAQQSAQTDTCLKDHEANPKLGNTFDCFDDAPQTAGSDPYASLFSSPGSQAAARGMTLPDYVVVGVGSSVAVVIFLIGRALRYVFAGRP